PIAPGTYPLILAGVLARLRSADSPDSQGLARLESLAVSATRLPARSETDPARLLERRLGKEEVKGRLQSILREHPAVRLALDEELVDINGHKGSPRRFDRLAQRTGAAYVVVEKILAADEALPADWATQGTTGYEFLNALNGILVSPAGERPLRALYDELRTVLGRFSDVAYESQR